MIERSETDEVNRKNAEKLRALAAKVLTLQQLLELSAGSVALQAGGPSRAVYRHEYSACSSMLAIAVLELLNRKHALSVSD